VPLDWTCGPIRIVDVRSLVGTTAKASWPQSPEITVDVLKADEKLNGDFQPGQIVVFHTGHLDTHLKPAPDDKGVWSDPLTGKTEGWPAPGPDAVDYLKGKGIRCIATDAPDLGGVDSRRALMTYWALGSRDMVGIEFLHNVDNAPKSGYFLFAATRIRGAHASPGRAMVLE
jgi:kynurenine formamidase